MFIRIKQKRFGKWEHYIWINLDYITSVEYFYKNGESSYMLTDIHNKHYDIINDDNAKLILEYINERRFFPKK